LKRKTILHLATTCGGGLDAAILNLCVGLTALSIDSRVVFPAIAGAQESVNRFRSVGIEAASDTRMFHGHARRTPSLYRKFRALARDAPETVVVLHHITFHLPVFDAVSAFTRRHHRVVGVLHHHTRLSEISGRRQALTALAAIFYRQLIVATPIAQHDLIKMRVSPSKISVVPYGVLFDADQTTRKSSRETLGLSGADLIVLCVARLQSYKGHRLLIDAVAALPAATLKRTKLVIVGTGEDEESLRQYAQDTSEVDVTFCGYVDDNHLKLYYSASDVFALASSEEGFGLVFVEAALHGLPSVGMNVGGVPFAISHESTGLLVDVNDPVGLTGALESLLSSETTRSEYGEAARRRAQQQFGLASMCEGFLRAVELP
jgi:glycosyltransferase involved in cell wall biosynthesis